MADEDVVVAYNNLSLACKSVYSIVIVTYLEYEIIHFVGLRDIRINYFPKNSLGCGPSSYLEYLIF